MTFIHAATWAFISLIVGLGFGFWLGWNKALHAAKVDAFAQRIVDRLRGK